VTPRRAAGAAVPGIAVAIAAFLRLDALGVPSYWLDEILHQQITTDVARLPWWRWFAHLHAEHAALYYLTQLATRLDRTNRKLGDLAFVDVTGRVAHAIMDLCSEPDAMTHPEGMQIKVSRQELSRLVGCSREMAGRVLKVLEDQGLLRATGKTIVVFGARPKMKTKPPLAAAAGRAGAMQNRRADDDDDDDDLDDDED